MDLPSPSAMLLPKLPSVGSQNASMTTREFFTAPLLTKELILQKIKCSSVFVVMVFPVSPCLWDSWYNTTMEWPSQGRWEPVWWQHLPVRERCSQIYRMCSQFMISVRCCFSKSQDSWVQEPKGGNGINVYRFTFSNKLAQFLFLASTNLGSAGLEALALKGGYFLPERTAIVPLNWRLKLAHGNFRLLC